MIKHMVFWKLKADDEAGKAAAVAEIAAALEPLVGIVPGLHSLVVRPNVVDTETSWDAALVSEHDSVADLKAYQAHPAHVDAAAVPGRLAQSRITVDVEL